MCLAAPSADKGFQLHYGPSDYAQPANVAPYVLDPNKETVDCVYQKTANDTDVYVSGYQFYMRPGSHHLIVNVNPEPAPDGFGTCQTNDMTPGILGAQTPKVEELEDPAPENQGLAVKVPAHSQGGMAEASADATAPSDAGVQGIPGLEVCVYQIAPSRA